MSRAMSEVMDHRLTSVARPALPMRAGAVLEKDFFCRIRRRALLEGCKWDPQVADTSTLSSFPLLLSRSEWNRLAAWAEQLSAEMFAAEREIVEHNPPLLRCLGLPRAVRRALESSAPLTPAAARMVRFDFHFTTGGWRISEGNSDVPGGYSESSFFTHLMAKHFPGGQPAGNPAEALCTELVCAGQTFSRPCRQRNSPPVIALLAAPGYMEDLQVVAYLSQLLRDRGCDVRLGTPAQLSWPNSRAHLLSSRSLVELSAVFRFFQGEWLARLPARCGWQKLFRGGATPVMNPGIAVVSESKRFPLTWERLATPMTTWRMLLPETRAPEEAPWRTEDGWLIKAAMCNNGDTVNGRETTGASHWKHLVREVRWFPGAWVAQRRFQIVPIQTPMGAMFPCIGVYTINGRACGAYARLARSEVVNFAAIDVALLIENE